MQHSCYICHSATLEIRLTAKQNLKILVQNTYFLLRITFTFASIPSSYHLSSSIFQRSYLSWHRAITEAPYSLSNPLAYIYCLIVLSIRLLTPYLVPSLLYHHWIYQIFSGTTSLLLLCQTSASLCRTIDMDACISLTHTHTRMHTNFEAPKSRVVLYNRAKTKL